MSIINNMILKGGTSDIKKMKLQAQKLIGNGKYDDALEILKELARVTSDPEVFNSIGDLYIRKQNHELALENLEKAYRMYKEQDFKEIAISIAKKIIRLDKERYDTYLDLVEMELDSGNIDKALDWALELIKLPNIDLSYVGKLFRLVNEFANAIQDHTEQAAKFERLFMRLQELAESLSIMSLESGIEFAEPQEFYEKGDFDSYGGFLGPDRTESTTTGTKASQRKEEEEVVEKVEFMEEEEEVREEQEEDVITPSGFADFLGVQKPEEEVSIPQSTGSGNTLEPPEERIPTEDLSEKTLVVEESPKASAEEGFKTVVEDVSEMAQEEQKVWESLSGKGEKKKDEVVTEEGRYTLEESLKGEENQEALRRSFEAFLETTEEKPVRGKQVEEKIVKEEIKKDKKTEARTSKPSTMAKKSAEVSAYREEREEEVFYRGVEKIPGKEDLLKVLRDLKEDLLTLEDWPFPVESTFEVAKEYYEMKLYSAAVEEFQKLLNDPRNRLNAMIFLGKIFYERGELEFAEVILRKAIEEIGYMEEGYIEAYYYLAKTLEDMKRFLEAKELYIRVYVFSSSFMDVSEKVKLLRSMTS